MWNEGSGLWRCQICKTAGNLTSVFPTACEMKDLDSGGAKSAKLREISLLYSRLLVKCRIWTLEVPKVQKLWEPNCVWNEESGVWGCQKWEKQFGNLTYSTFPTLPSTNRRDFWARFQILHSTRSREYRSEISRSF